MDTALLAELLRKYPTAMLPSGGIITCVARLSFPSLDKPRKMEGSTQEPKFQASLLFPSGADLTLLKTEIQRLANEKFPAGIPSNFKNALKKQDDKAEQYDGYTAGNFVLSASGLRRPGMVDSRMVVITDPNKFYGGCWVRASVRLYAFDKGGGKGVGAGLNNLQFIADDDGFGGTSLAENDFSAVEGAPAPAGAPQTNGAAPAPASTGLAW